MFYIYTVNTWSEKLKRYISLFSHKFNGLLIEIHRPVLHLDRYINQKKYQSIVMYLFEETYQEKTPKICGQNCQAEYGCTHDHLIKKKNNWLVLHPWSEIEVLSIKVKQLNKQSMCWKIQWLSYNSVFELDLRWLN